MQVCNFINFINPHFLGRQKDSSVSEKKQSDNGYTYQKVPLSTLNAYTSPIIHDEYKKIQNFDIPYIGKGEFFQLKNGHNVIIIPSDGRTYVTTVVNTGFSNEPENKKGIAHLTEHLLTNNSFKPQKEEREIIESLNADVSAQTSDAFTFYKLTANVKNQSDLRKLISLQFENLTKDKFDNNSMTKEINVIKQELMSFPQHASSDLIAENYSIDNLLNIPCKFPKTDIEQININDLKMFYQKYYTPDNMTTFVIGNVDANTIKTVSNIFGKRGKKYNQYKEIVKNDYSHLPITSELKITKYNTTEMPKSEIVYSFPGPTEKNYCDIEKVKILIDLLQRKLKENGFNASTNIQIRKVGRDVPLIIVIKLNEEKTNTINSIQKINKIIKEFQEEPISLSELQESKENVESEIYQSLDNKDELVIELMENLYGNNIDIRAKINRANSATAEDILETANKYLNIGKSSLMVLNIDPVKESSPTFKSKTNYIEEVSLPNNFKVIFDTNPNNTIAVVSCELPFEKNNIPIGTIDAMAYSLQDDKKIHNSMDTKGIYIRADNRADSITSVLEHVKETLLNPVFDSVALEKIKKEQRTNIKQNNTISVSGLLLERNAIPKTLAEICPSNETIKNLKENYENLISSSQGYIVISLPPKVYQEKRQKILDILSSYPNVKPSDFNKINDIKPLELDKNYIYIEKEDNADYINFEKKYKILINDNPQMEATAILLNYFLNKYVIDKYRNEDSISYSPETFCSKASSKHMILNIFVSSYYDKLDTKLKNIYSDFDKLRINNLSRYVNNNFEVSKNNVIDTLLNSDKDSQDRNMNITLNYRKTYNTKYNQDLAAVIKNIDKETFLNLADKILSQNSVIVVSGNSDAINENINQIAKNRTFVKSYL